MRARVKATGEIWEFSQIDEITFKSAINGHLYCAEELEFLEPSVFTPDYWERLKHQYAGMFLKAQISYGEQENLNTEEMIEDAIIYATALVEKLKKEEKK